MEFGRTLLFGGALLIAIGLAVIGLEKLGIPLGRMPGDIDYASANFRVSFPIVTCLVVSVVLTLLFNLFFRK